MTLPFPSAHITVLYERNTQPFLIPTPSTKVSSYTSTQYAAGILKVFFSLKNVQLVEQRQWSCNCKFT